MDNPLPQAERLRSSRVPRYVWNYVDQLKGDYCAVASGDTYPALVNAATHLFTWGDVFALESLILRVNPEDNLRRVVWRWRARFRRIAGESTYQIYVDSNPPDASFGDINAIRADLGSLAGELHYLYILSPAREVTRDWFYMWSFIGVLAVITILSILLRFGPYKDFPALAVIMFAGWAGGLISVQERLNRLPTEIRFFSNCNFKAVGGAFYSHLSQVHFCGDPISLLFSSADKWDFVPDHRDRYVVMAAGNAIYGIFAIYRPVARCRLG